MVNNAPSPRHEAGSSATTGGVALTRNAIIFVLAMSAGVASAHSACGGSTSNGSSDAGVTEDATLDGSGDVATMSDAPADVSPPGDGGSDCSSFLRDGADDCSYCGAINCCAQAAASSDSDAYLGFVECLNQGLTELPDGALVPTTTVCEGSTPESNLLACCSDAYPAGSQLSMALSECLATSCPTECQ